MGGINVVSHGIEVDNTTLQKLGSQISIKDGGVGTTQLTDGDVALVDLVSGLVGMTVIDSGTATLTGDNTVQDIGSFTTAGDIGNNFIYVDVFVFTDLEDDTSDLTLNGTATTAGQIQATNITDGEAFVRFILHKDLATSTNTIGAVTGVEMAQGEISNLILTSQLNFTAIEQVFLNINAVNASTCDVRWVAYKTNF